MKFQDNSSVSYPQLPILDMIDNINKKFSLGRQEYLMLIKKQKDKDYCTLYLSDCQSKVWVKKIDRSFLEKAKQSMSINSDLQVFTMNFAKNIKENSKISIEEEVVTFDIELKIGQGLLMTYKLTMENYLGLEESPNDYKVVLKIFIKQLFEAKESQIEEQRKKWQQEVKEKKQSKPAKKDREFVNEVLHGMKKDADLKPKNRSLMNPNQKRRKEAKIKFQGTL